MALPLITARSAAGKPALQLPPPGGGCAYASLFFPCYFPSYVYSYRLIYFFFRNNNSHLINE
ncbi:hypothetical protein ES15_1536 [Cronobacter sakazakii ES15]|nr:hypothetical protein ES15_1536 [Cronobacter sakazakii ES15]